MDWISNYLREPASEIEAANVVEFFDWRDPQLYSYSIVFETAAHRFVEVGILPWCGADLSYPTGLHPRI